MVYFFIFFLSELTVFKTCSLEWLFYISAVSVCANGFYAGLTETLQILSPKQYNTQPWEYFYRICVMYKNQCEQWMTEQTGAVTEISGLILSDYRYIRAME
jgi:hypothetical protein